MTDQTPPKTERLEDWCELLIKAIARRANITYALNELMKTNTKTSFTEAAKGYLKIEQSICNDDIKAIVYVLINGHKPTRVGGGQ